MKYGINGEKNPCLSATQIATDIHEQCNKNIWTNTARKILKKAGYHSREGIQYRRCDSAFLAVRPMSLERFYIDFYKDVFVTAVILPPTKHFVAVVKTIQESLLITTLERDLRGKNVIE
ncbi:hypothetical protein TNCV_3103591 [Trichonephila clavipes]|nr:hypothetical protein TNCV_3103591 [Trichonephila clavipes]